MKTLSKVFAFLLIAAAGILLIPSKAVAQGASVSFQVFYDELSPYGYWVNNPDYGYVWVPNVAAGFTPYSTNGYWVFTDQGWTWVSAYPWGWAPFHYGRWYTDAHYGPMWVPGNQWGPGWVTWRRSAGYYGWAPIGPGVSISVTYSSGYHVPHNHWRFVRDRDFGRTDINKYYVNNSNNVTIINNSTVINNARIDKTHNVNYNGGPDRAEVEKKSGRKFNPVAIKESSKPGEKMNKDRLELYRPHVQNNITGDKKPAPAKVVNMKDTKTPAQKTDQSSPLKANQPEKQKASQPRNTGGEKQQQNTTQPVKHQPSNQQHKDGKQGKESSPKQQDNPPKK